MASAATHTSEHIIRLRFFMPTPPNQICGRILLWPVRYGYSEPSLAKRTMATAARAAISPRRPRMPEEKGLFAGLFDFSFQELLSRRIVKLLYIIALVGGGIAVVAEVVLELRVDTAMGLLALVAGVVALFIWILITRVALECVLALFRIADNIERATHSSN